MLRAKRILRCMRPRINFRLTIQYDGRPFCGWQRQKNGLSIQQCVETVCEELCGNRCSVHGAGRTDAGVHAAGQVASVRMPTELAPYKIKKALNSLLTPEIRIASVRRAPDNFHARTDALRKVYRYLVLTGPERSPFAPFYAAWTPYQLSIAPMREAAGLLVGRKDFRSFQASGSSVRTTEREILGLEVRRGGGIVSIVASADGFLRQMVRIIVGTLIEVGRGKLDPDEVEHILQERDRRLAGPTAPAGGLTLMRVEY